MIKIAKFDEEDYETYKDFVNSIKSSLEPNGELYAFEYERVQGYVYRIHDSFDIFMYGEDGKIQYIPVAYDSENDIVLIETEGDPLYDKDGASLGYEDGSRQALFCIYMDEGSSVSYQQYNAETDEELILSYIYPLKHDGAQYLFWNDQKVPFMIMFRKDVKSRGLLGSMPKDSDYYIVNPNDSFCYPVKKFTDDGAEYSLKFWKYKSLADMLNFLHGEGFNTSVSEEMLNVYNFRFTKYDYLSFIKELIPAIEAESSYTFKLGDGDSDNSVN